MTGAELEKIADETFEEVSELIRCMRPAQARQLILAALQKVSAADRAELAKQVDRNAEYLHNLKRLRGAKEVAEAQLAAAEAQLSRLTVEVERLREVIRGVLDSATPHPIEHPNMFQAFAAARAALAQTGEKP